MQMLLTGQPISANKAQEIGLINEAVPEEELEEEVDSVADQIAAMSSTAISTGKPTFVQQMQLPLHDAYQLASRTMCENTATEQCEEGISAFLEKRKPNW